MSLNRSCEREATGACTAAAQCVLTLRARGSSLAGSVIVLRGRLGARGGRPHSVGARAVMVGVSTIKAIQAVTAMMLVVFGISGASRF